MKPKAKSENKASAPATSPPGMQDADGWGSLENDRLHQLVRQAGNVVDRTFEIEFFETGVRAYAFTFGLSTTQPKEILR
jgi:hypothetical protein